FPELRKKAAKELDGVEDGATTDREGAGSARRSDDSSGDEPTKEELYQQAKDAGIEGRSTMTKRELEEALREQR
ncbi:MAG: Rho termination factor, partial [Acidimicrobiales bacterium]|nr:Rho termination factor [Acidimicrobiales bacterium]